jgi:pimeloyl-ACP methyl ester carboxylesterase
VRLHFVEGGSGTPILLLPAWPQSWYAWRYVMPLLVKAGRAAVDIRRWLALTERHHMRARRTAALTRRAARFSSEFTNLRYCERH